MHINTPLNSREACGLWALIFDNEWVRNLGKFWESICPIFLHFQAFKKFFKWNMSSTASGDLCKLIVNFIQCLYCIWVQIRLFLMQIWCSCLWHSTALHCPSTLLFCDVLAAHTHIHTHKHTHKSKQSF